MKTLAIAPFKYLTEVSSTVKPNVTVVLVSPYCVFCNGKNIFFLICKWEPVVLFIDFQLIISLRP